MVHFALTTALLFAQPPEGAAPASGGTDSSIAATSAVAPENKPASSNNDLLRRIEALEAAEKDRTPTPSARSTAATFIQNRFNPDISIIADFALAGTSLDDKSAQTLTVPGFIASSVSLAPPRSTTCLNPVNREILSSLQIQPGARVSFHEESVASVLPSI